MKPPFKSLPRVWLLGLLLVASIGGCNTFFDADSIRPEGCAGANCVETSSSSGDADADGDSTRPPDTMSSSGGDVTDTRPDADTTLPVDTSGGDAPMDADAAVCDCPQGQGCCGAGGACEDTQANAAHCGACGVVCGEGETCEEGQCVCGIESSTGGRACAVDSICCQDACMPPDDSTCPCGGMMACGTGQSCCNDSCRDSDSDPMNCGGCDVQCNDFRGTPSCISGGCVLACDAGFGDCDGDPDTGCEADVLMNDAHCGMCDRACDTSVGLICVAGDCEVSCSGDIEDCDNDPSNGCETDTQNGDTAHCGACDLACGNSATCTGGVCLCDDTNVCPRVGATHDNAQCSGALCQLACLGPTRDCNADAGDSCEVDVTNDPLHCGGCGQPCGVGGSCSASMCDGIDKLVVGVAHTCALRENGKVLCWGQNNSGQIGVGGAINQPSPVLIAIGGDTTYTAIDLDAGANHTCAVLDIGEVWCWGDNTYGQLGDGASANTSLLPKRAGLALTDATAITLGSGHSCVIRTNETVACWGRGDRGQIGDGMFNMRTSQTPVSGLSAVNTIDAGKHHTCARLADASLWCWGEGTQGQLSNEQPLGPNATPQIVRQDRAGVIVDMANVLGFSAGGDHTCAVVSGEGGTCWGANDDGQLGTPSAGDVALAPLSYLSYGQFSAGDFHTCALDVTTDQALCWGFNFSGQLGNNDQGGGASTSVPQIVQGLTAPDLVAAGGGHSCARDADRRLYCWGDGASGQRGVGNFTPITPTATAPVTGLP